MKTSIIFSILLIVTLNVSQGQTTKAKFEPEAGKKLLIIGQDLGAIGGFVAPNNTGYVNSITTIPGGVTTYTSLPNLGGLRMKTNYGSGDLNGQAIIDNPLFKNAALSIGLYMVNQEGATAEGKNDSQIKTMAKWIKDANRPVFLRIGYEFDGNWNHYNPAAYKEAFRRMKRMFDSLGVTNCAMVWQACTSPVDDIIEGKKEDINDWYPGDEYVDWIGYSWFLNSPKQIELTDEVIAFAKQHKKPVMVCEACPQGYDLANLTKRNIVSILDGPAGEGLKKKSPEEIWTEWYQPFFDYIEKNKEVVKVVAYINANWDAQPMWGAPYKEGYWGDSRVEANAAIKEKWLTKIKAADWLNASPELFKQLGFTKEEQGSGYRR